MSQDLEIPESITPALFRKHELPYTRETVAAFVKEVGRQIEGGVQDYDFDAAALRVKAQLQESK